MNPLDAKPVQLAGRGGHLVELDAVPGHRRPIGESPAVVLIEPQFAHNVGQAVRACSCWDFAQLWWTGGAVSLDVRRGGRLPREERMRGYADVALFRAERPLDHFPPDATPVAVELRPGSEPLHHFEHPDRAVYVFGPENGSIPKPVLHRCHGSTELAEVRFVVIPSSHCLNLAAAVNVVGYDRRVKRVAAGLEADLESRVDEDRGWTVKGAPR